MSEQPRILLFTGDGKGKTTAALGMALRAAGHGMDVLVIQFVKHDSTTGEVAAIRSVDHIELEQTGRGFIPSPESPEFAEHQEAAKAGLARAAEAILSGKYSLVVLDEICFALARGLIVEQEMLELIGRLPNGMRLVLTGRDAPPALIDVADTVSEVRSVKHALQAGRPAQKGVEM